MRNRYAILNNTSLPSHSITGIHARFVTSVFHSYGFDGEREKRLLRSMCKRLAKNAPVGIISSSLTRVYVFSACKNSEMNTVKKKRTRKKPTEMFYTVHESTHTKVYKNNKLLCGT